MIALLRWLPKMQEHRRLQRGGSADDDFIHGLVPPCVGDWSYYVDILMCVYFCIGYYGSASSAGDIVIAFSRLPGL